MKLYIHYSFYREEWHTYYSHSRGTYKLVLNVWSSGSVFTLCPLSVGGRAPD